MENAVAGGVESVTWCAKWLRRFQRKGVCAHARGKQICLKHGISISICLSKRIPEEILSLEMVGRECVFVTKELKEMEPNHLFCHITGTLQVVTSVLVFTFSSAISGFVDDISTRPTQN